MIIATVEETSYPKLKIHSKSNRIVLFTAGNCGTQLNTIETTEFSKHHVGYYGTHWVESNYIPYKGMVILAGDDNG